MNGVRWLLRNLSTLFLSFLLAITVWASAVVTADPNQDGAYQDVPIEIIGLASDLLLTNEIPTQATLTFKAPRSIWDQLSKNPKLVRAWIDLTGLAAGEYDVKVNAQVALSPVRIQQIDPALVQVILEPLVIQTRPVELHIKGETPLGYRKGQAISSPDKIVMSGPASAVERVKTVVASLDISGASQTVKTTAPVHAFDENGAAVVDVTLAPKEINIIQPISILGGYKNVAVKVVTTGQVAEGYRLTNISVSPPTVTVYSTDPQLVDDLPGYIETNPVDLTGLSDDTEFNSSLNLPEGISLVSEPSVLAQVGVAAIEGSLTMTIPVEYLGLPPTLTAIISPSTVDVIVTGPLPILDTLTPASFRAVVELGDRLEGIYQINPKLDLAPQGIKIQALIPETVEVTIQIAPTATPTRPVTPTPRGSLPAPATPIPTRQP